MNRKLLLLAILMIVGAWGKTYAQELVEGVPVNADLSSLSGWDYGDPFDGGTYNYTDYKTPTEVAVPVIEFYHSWNANAGGHVSPTKNFHLTQEVKLPAGNYRLAVNGFYREGNGNGTNTKAYIFAGDKKQYMHGMTSQESGEVANANGLYSTGIGGDKEIHRAAKAFSIGDFSNEFDFDVEINEGDEDVVVENGVTKKVIEIGFRGYIDTYCSWCILGPVKLYKYSLEDYLVVYREKVAEAEALYNEPMNATVLSDLVDAVLEESSFTLSKQVTAQITILNEKIAAAKTSIADYAATKAALEEYDAKATANLDADAQAAYNNAVADIRTAYDNGTMTTSQAEAVKAAYQAALKNQGVGGDITECAPTTWVGSNGTFDGMGKDHVVAERYNPKDGVSYEYEGDVMYQTIEGLPEGAVYKVTLEAAASFTSGRDFECKTGDDLAVVFANTSTVNLPVVDRGWVSDPNDCGPYEVIGKVGSDGKLKYGIQKIDALGGNWFLVNLLSIERIEYVPVQSIVADNVTVEQLQTVAIGATVEPADATLPEITYVSADEEIATVDKNGVVTGVAEGSTTITMTADGVTASIAVEVTAPAIVPESISVEPTELSLQLGGKTTDKLIATVLPEEANQEVSFASGDEGVVTVDSEGNVTAVGIGETSITITSSISSDVTTTVDVTVSAAEVPTNISDEIVEGKDYWLRNAATGKYLGGANNWSTRASLIEHGIPFKAAKAAEGVYTLDSYTDNGNNRHFLAGEWIDGAATNITFTKNDNGTFSLKIAKGDEGEFYLQAKSSDTKVDLVGTDTSNPYAQWYVLSIDDRIANLEDGSDTDATFFIKDFDFSRNNTMISYWKETHSEGGNFRNNQIGAPSDEAQSNWNFESYHNTFYMEQMLEVPNGIYNLTAQGFYEGSGSLPVFFANDQEATLPVKNGSENSMHTAAVSFTAGNYKIDPIEVEVTDHILRIGVKNEENKGLWCIWDNFELELVELSADQDINVKIGPVGYATLYYGNLNLVAPEGVKVSTATVDGSSIILEDVEGVIPAGTGVVLQADPAPATATDYPFSVSYEAAPELSNSNQLQGTDEETEIAEAGFKYYVLSTKKGSNGDANTVGFYWQDEENEGSKVINGAHKAYLAVEESVAGDINGFVFDNATGIQTVEKATVINGEAYSLSGIRVDGSQLQKGIYIVNGKKIVIK